MKPHFTSQQLLPCQLPFLHRSGSQCATASPFGSTSILSCAVYSGMLPGYVSGFYTYDDCHIDLSRLATFAKSRLIHAEASGIDIKVRG